VIAWRARGGCVCGCVVAGRCVCVCDRAARAWRVCVCVWWRVGVRRPVYPLILDQPEGCCIVGDSAFPHTGPFHGKLLTPLKESETRRLSPEDRVRSARHSRAVINMRQAVEWGNRILQSSWPRIKTRLSADHMERGRLFSVCIGLFNVKARRMGNQISQVYDPGYQPPMGANSVERAAAFFHGGDD